MPEFIVENREGAERAIQGEAGVSVMEAIRDSEAEALIGVCGGCCLCGTCHVYVDLDLASALTPMGDEERALLDCLEFRTPASRLSCQLSVMPALEGARFVMAPGG